MHPQITLSIGDENLPVILNNKSMEECNMCVIPMAHTAVYLKYVKWWGV